MIKLEKIKGVYTHGDLIAGLKNDIFNLIWSHLGVSLQEKLVGSNSEWDKRTYFNFNRDLSDALDKRIKTLWSEIRLDKSRIPSEYLEREKSHIQERMAHQLAKEIMKSDTVVLREIDYKMHPEITYSICIPIISFNDTQRSENETRD